MPFLTVRLPKEGEILVTESQAVSVGDLLAKGENPQLVSLEVSRLFKVKPQQVKKLLIKKIGEEVKAGEVVAQKKSFFSKSSLKSPISGILEKMDEERGTLFIKGGEEGFALKAKVSGKVKEVKGKEEIVIEFPGIEIEAEQGVGPKKEGKITVLKTSQINLPDLNLDLAEKIVVGKTWGRSSLSKAKGLGIAAVLAQEVEDADCLKVGEEKKLPLLGLQSSDFALLIFSPVNFQKVLKYEGYQATVWGDEKTLLIGST